MTQKQKCHDESGIFFTAAMRHLTHTIRNVHNNLHVNQTKTVSDMKSIAAIESFRRNRSQGSIHDDYRLE